MKRILALALATSFPLIAIAAIPQPSQASLDKLVEVARVSLIHDSILKTLDQSADRVSMYATNSVHGVKLTPAEKASIDGLSGQVRATVAAGFSEEMVNDIFAKEYASKFDQKEVDGLIAFFSSPVGQEYATKQLGINTNVGLALQRTIGALGGPVQKTINAVVNPILAAHAPKPAAKPSMPVKPSTGSAAASTPSPPSGAR